VHCQLFRLHPKLLKRFEQKKSSSLGWSYRKVLTKTPGTQRAARFLKPFSAASAWFSFPVPRCPSAAPPSPCALFQRNNPHLLSGPPSRRSQSTPLPGIAPPLQHRTLRSPRWLPYSALPTVMEQGSRVCCAGFPIFRIVLSRTPLPPTALEWKTAAIVP